MPGRQGAPGRVLAVGCGPHQPCASSLTATPSLARLFAGDELRKDGGNSDQPRSLRRTNRSQHRAPNLGIRSVLKTTGGSACRHRHREIDNEFFFFLFYFFNFPQGIGAITMNTITHQDTQALHAAVFTATIAAYDLLLIPLSQLRPSSRNVGV